MELKSFRDVLLKKADGDPRLEILVASITQERLANKVIESLKKMARLSRASSRNPNSALLAYASHMTGGDVEQLRDALGHHIAHYKAALKAHHSAQDPKEKAKLRRIADQHLEHIVPMAHLAARAEHHSNGTIAADLPPIRAWQANYTGTHKFPSGPLDADGKVTFKDPVTDKEVGPGRPGAELIGTEGWGGRPAKNKRPNHDHHKSRSTQDYRYLEMEAHPEHSELANTHHRGAFPFEDIRIGAPSEVDAGGGHLHIPDVETPSEYTPHDFDSHPIRNIFDASEKNITSPMRDKFTKDFTGWKSSKTHQGWLDRHEAEEVKNPEEYAKRGTSKSTHVFEGLPFHDKPHHAKGKAAQASAAPAVPAAQQPPTAPAISPENMANLPEALRRKQGV